MGLLHYKLNIYSINTIYSGIWVRLHAPFEGLTTIIKAPYHKKNHNQVEWYVMVGGTQGFWRALSMGYVKLRVLSITDGWRTSQRS